MSGTAFAFWLRYLESQGGLWEPAEGSVLAVLPDHLATGHDLPESALITDDPNVAREDGALFLGAGHPAIDQAAQRVITRGDLGTLTLTHHSRALPTEDLLAKLRDQVPVGHGRIDAAASALPSRRAQLRLGALIHHSVSAEEQFTEVAECLIDVLTLLPWPDELAGKLLSAATDAEPGARLDQRQLLPALAAARDELDSAARRRGQELAASADTESAAEIERAREYYAAALAALDKRRGSADHQRRALLDARAEVTRAERDRRLAEIAEKYQHQHELRPYRVHLIDVAVLRLATDVRRGARRWPVTFDYLPHLGVFAPTRCPSCDAHAPLVASKARLGCERCLSLRVAPPPAPVKAAPAKPAPTAEPAEPAPGAKRLPTKEPAAAKKPSCLVQPALVPEAPRFFRPGKPEDKKVTSFWNHVAGAEHRKLSRLIAPDSPLAALLRLYRSTGPLYAIGVPAGAEPEQFSFSHHAPPVGGRPGGTGGKLRTRKDHYQYLLLWSSDGLIEEIYPYAMPWHLGRAAAFLPARVRQAPPPVVELDPVASLLFTQTTSTLGLPFSARALAAWWRLPDAESFLARFEPRALAAAIERSIRYWSSLADASYTQAAAAFRADETQVRKATPPLQKNLQLSQTRPW